MLTHFSENFIYLSIPKFKMILSREVPLMHKLQDVTDTRRRRRRKGRPANHRRAIESEI